MLFSENTGDGSRVSLHTAIHLHAHFSLSPLESFHVQSFCFFVKQNTKTWFRTGTREVLDCTRQRRNIPNHSVVVECQDPEPMKFFQSREWAAKSERPELPVCACDCSHTCGGTLRHFSIFFLCRVSVFDMKLQRLLSRSVTRVHVALF